MSFSSFGSLSLDVAGSMGFTNIDISGGDQTVSISVNAETGNEKIYRQIRLGEGLSMVSNTCQINQTLSQGDGV